MGGWELLFSTLGLAIVSAFIPVVNAELLTLGAVALAPPAWDISMVLMVSLGQILGKIVLFLVGRGTLQIPWMVKAEKIEKAGERFGVKGGLGTTVLAASAFTGLPPFYLVSIACGMFRYSLTMFIIIGSVGRLLRFGLIGLFPDLFGALFT